MTSSVLTKASGAAGCLTRELTERAAASLAERQRDDSAEQTHARRGRRTSLREEIGRGRILPSVEGTWRSLRLHSKAGGGAEKKWTGQKLPAETGASCVH